jgi:phosphoribosylanthranilate isomerase
MINGKLIKVCGMRDGENIRQVESLGIDMLGFIFYPKSPRFVEKVPNYLPQKAKRVGVFVDETQDTVEMYAKRFELDYIQLHGHESPGYCRSLYNKGIKLIKAFPIANENDLEKAGLQDYAPLCSFFLFDYKCEQHGGSGKQFDWQVLHQYQGNTPFLLSGGINEQSDRDLLAFHHPMLAGYDLNSRFEASPGLKDAGTINSLLNKLKNNSL